MSQDELLQEMSDAILTITLNHPDVMNALSLPLLEALDELIDQVRFQKEVRVIIITGTGERAFCSGADLKERRTFTPEMVQRYIFTIGTLFSKIENLNKPVIAAVNGIALGGGTELALASDIRIASATALMGLTETRLAIIPGAGGTQRLPRLVGKGKAKELIFTGRRIDAQTALSIGLVNEVAAPEELLDQCQKMAAEICSAGPLAIEQAKKVINYGMETDLATGMALESSGYWTLIPTEDRLEGLAAFKEKRPPEYKGE